MNQNSSRSSKERRVLIVGGAGYVGTVLTRQLLDQGYAVRVLDNLIYGQGFALRQFLNEPAFTFVQGDLRDPGDLQTSLNGATDVVLLAGLVGDPICKTYPQLAKAVNLDGCKSVFDSLNGRGIGSFVFASSCSNYGLRETDDLATEESDLNPGSLYAECKVAVERHILDHAGDVDVSPTVLRVATAYGFSQRMRFDLTVSEFTRELALGNPLLVYDETTWRPYCHVVDMARAIISVLDAKSGQVAGKVFNVGNSDENFTKKMIVDVIEQTLGESGADYREGGVDPRNYRVSFDKISAVLGFRNSRSVGQEVPMLAAAVRQGLFADDGTDPNLYGNREIAGAS